MTENEASWVIDGWYRVAHNEGVFNALPSKSGHGGGDDEWQRDFDAMSFGLVNKVLDEIGTGVYAPRELVRLIEHQHKIGTIDGFELFGPVRGLPPEILGLGFRTSDLIQLAYRRLIKRLCKINLPKYFEAA